MKKYLATTALCLGLGLGGVATAQAAPLNIVFTIHSSASTHSGRRSRRAMTTPAR